MMSLRMGIAFLVNTFGGTSGGSDDDDDEEAAASSVAERMVGSNIFDLW